MKTIGPLIVDYMRTTALTRNVQPAAYSRHLRRVGLNHPQRYRDGIAIKVGPHRFLFIMLGGADMRQSDRESAEYRANRRREVSA